MRTALFLLFFFSVLSCRKADDEPTPHRNSFSAVVNGTAYRPGNIEVLFGGSSIPGARQVNISTVDQNGTGITLILSDYDGTVKTFAHHPNQVIGTYARERGLSNFSASINGQITLTNIDPNTYKEGEVVNGTFAFDTDATAGTYVVTNGNFSVFVRH